MTIGILATGAYIPRLRLTRRVIAEANSWLNPALKGHAKGERAICNWDEDAVTMAVEAGRDALAARDRDSIANLHFASTTFPFLDRLNAGIVSDALRLPDGVHALDIASAQRAATSALHNALGGSSQTLIVASEKRRAKAASPLEMSSGDAAAALVIGDGEPIARLIGSATRTADFIDHYRTADSVFDYQWEERWIRDAGYLTIVPPVIARCLDSASVKPSDVAHFCMPAALPRVANALAKAAGIADSAVSDSLQAGCGDTGTAHPLIMLVASLEKAKPGERIMVVGFGQGADALLFEVTAAMPKTPGRLGVSGHLARRREETNYAKFLAFNDTIDIERGMRAETDKQTPLSAMWRNHEAVTAFIGGRCRTCGTLQFPKSRVCVNPNCNAVDTQEPHPFADKIGRINSYTADRLTYSPDPPACYGMIQFEGGGRWMMDFTDVEADSLTVGTPMRMTFRVKDIDAQRGFRRYFWKAAPTPSNTESV
jgi:hydroxymethylglutaryl-CoA synthase